MLGQWTLGEEALGEIDGSQISPLVANATVWFTELSVADVFFSATVATKVTMSVKTIAIVCVSAEVSNTTVSN